MVREPTSTAAVRTPLGTFVVEATAEGVSRIGLPGGRSRELAGDEVPSAIAAAATRQLLEYVGGERTEFDVEIDWTGEVFVVQVARGYRLAPAIWVKPEHLGSSEARIRVHRELVAAAWELSTS